MSIKNQPIDIIDNINIDLENTLLSLTEYDKKILIDFLNEEYYNNGKTYVSDQIYDYIVDHVEKQHTTIKVEKNMVKLPYYMGSLNKIKPSNEEFYKWIYKYKGPYIIGYKLDGQSGLLYKDKLSNSFKLFTKGNGYYGKDISFCIKYLANYNNIKKIFDKINYGDAVRGELIMSKVNFNKIKSEMSNPRNAVCGMLNSKTLDTNLIKNIKLIDFVAYGYLSENTIKISDQLEFLDKNHFDTVDYNLFSKINLEDLSVNLITGRTEYKYIIDGLVVIDDSQIYEIIDGENPRYGFAYKQILTDQRAESVVVDVEWKISKDGYLKPRIKIDEVEIAGSKINYVTAHNAKYIYDNNIHVGTLISIIKSGDVIPYITDIKNLDENKNINPKMPVDIEYEWTETGVDIIAININEDNQKEIISQKIYKFFSNLDVKFMGEKTVIKFIENGYDNIIKIIIFCNEQNVTCDFMSILMINKMKENINEMLKNVKIYELMGSCEMFNRGIGIRKCKLIFDEYPNFINMYLKLDKNKLLDKIISISGFEELTATKIVENFNKFYDFYNNINDIKIKYNLVTSNEVSISNELIKYKGKNIVFSGFRDAVLKTKLEEVGANIKTSISKNTDYVFTKENTNSSKLDKAIELGIEIIKWT